MHWLRKPCERSFRKVKSTGSIFSDLLASFLLLASPVNIPIGAPWGQKFKGFENLKTTQQNLSSNKLGLSFFPKCEGASENLRWALIACVFSSNVNNLWKGLKRPYSVDDPLFLWKRNHILPLAWNETLTVSVQSSMSDVRMCPNPKSWRRTCLIASHWGWSVINVWRDFDRKKNADNVISNQVIHCHELAHRLYSFHKKSQ